MSLSGGSAGGTIPPFNPSVTVDATTTLDAGAGAQNWIGRGYVTRRTDGVLVLVYRRASAHNEDDADLAIRFSDDDGATWTAVNTTLAAAAVTGFPMNPPIGNISYGEGVPLTCPNGDLIIEMWSVTGISPTGDLNGTYQSRSTDDGATWSTPEAVTFDGNPNGDTDTFMSDDFFIYNRVIYMGARYYSQEDGDPSASLLMKSADNGNNWEYVSTIQGVAEGGTGGQEVGLEYVGNDTILAMIRDNPHTSSYRRISTDMGLTWGTLTDVTSLVGIAARQKLYTLNHLQGVEGWWKDPRIIMEGFVHQSSGNSQPRRACVWFSPDRGTTWDGPHYVDTSTDDAGYGDLWGKADGTTGMVNYHGDLGVAALRQYDLSVDLAP